MPFFVFLKTVIGSGPAELVLCGSGLGWSCAGSLCQSIGVGPGVLVLSWGPCEV